MRDILQASCHLYKYLGAHISVGSGVSFRVWAPNAYSVSVVGDFCDWSGGLPMKKADNGVWELFLESDKISKGNKYKYKITGAKGTALKADPVGCCIESGGGGASVLWDTESYSWRDGGWMKNRRRQASVRDSLPMNIYEMHLSSWKRHDGQPFSYRELAQELAPYVKQMGYTHVEIIPVGEDELNGCCGYRRESYFAPDSGYGLPEELMSFIDSMHEAGVGVILDWIPTGFSPVAHGLSEFDGQMLYESGYKCEVGNYCKLFRQDSPDVDCFLVSSALFWLKEYHVDGLRIGNVDPKRKMYGLLYSEVERLFPDVMLISDNPTVGGGFARDGAWAEVALKCAATEPFERETVYRDIVDSVEVGLKTRRILSVSHCDGLGGKGSMLEQMSGDYWQKFAGARAFLGCMMTVPGKKLSFMGCEIGEFKPWKNTESLEWFLLDYDAHARLQCYIAELNHLYLGSPELWSLDSKENGFAWINSCDSRRGVMSYRRLDGEGNQLIAVVNITPNAYIDYSLGVPQKGTYCEIFNSDSLRFGGSGVVNDAPLGSLDEGADGFETSIRLSVPPLAITILKFVGTTTD